MRPNKVEICVREGIDNMIITAIKSEVAIGKLTPLFTGLPTILMGRKSLNTRTRTSFHEVIPLISSQKHKIA